MTERSGKKLSAWLPPNIMDKLNQLSLEAGHGNKTQILIDLINKSDDDRALYLLKKIDEDNAKIANKLDVIMALLAKKP